MMIALRIRKNGTVLSAPVIQLGSSSTPILLSANDQIELVVSCDSTMAGAVAIGNIDSLGFIFSLKKL